MDHKKIQALAAKISYDLETVRFLLDYGRVKETWPVVQKVLSRVEALKGALDQSRADLKGIFNDPFWQRTDIDRKKTADVFKAVQACFADGNEDDLEDRLEKANYTAFLWLLNAWVAANIARVNGRIASPEQKRNTARFLIAAAFLIVAAIGAKFLQDYRSRVWGLSGDFYQGANFEKLVASGVNKEVDFASRSEMNPKMPKELSTARWEGGLIAPRDGRYAFAVVIDDGARLFIDNKVCIDEWHGHDSEEFSCGVRLNKGAHKIRLEYVNYYGGAVLRLFWRPPQGDRRIIPAEFLRLRQ